MLSESFFTYKSNVNLRRSSTITKPLTLTTHLPSRNNVHTIFQNLSKDPSVDLHNKVEDEKILNDNIQELCELNNKFAQYIERVHFLEARNKNLLMELSFVEKSAIGYHNLAQSMINEEIDALKKSITKSMQERKHLENEIEEKEQLKQKLNIIIQSPENELLQKELKQKLEEITDHVSVNEAKCNSLRRKHELINNELNTKTLELKTLQNQLTATIEQSQREKAFTSQQNLKKAKLVEHLDEVRKEHTNRLRGISAHSLDIIDQVDFNDNELLDMLKEVRKNYEWGMDQHRNGLKNKLLSDYYKIITKKYDNRRMSSAGNIHSTTIPKVKEVDLQISLYQLQREVSQMASNNIALHDTLQKLNRNIVKDQEDGERTFQTKSQQLKDLQEKSDEINAYCESISNANKTIKSEVDKYRGMLDGDSSRTGLKQIIEECSIRCIPKKFF